MSRLDFILKKLSGAQSTGKMEAALNKSMWEVARKAASLYKQTCDISKRYDNIKQYLYL